MRTRQPDPAFLYMAVMAATGGVLAICASIGYPIWQAFHGQPYRPAFSLFAAWGIAALMGAGACLNTYFMTDTPPPKPPGGGVRLELMEGGAAAVPPANVRDQQQRAA